MNKDQIDQLSSAPWQTYKVDGRCILAKFVEVSSAPREVTCFITDLCQCASSQLTEIDLNGCSLQSLRMTAANFACATAQFEFHSDTGPLTIFCTICEGTALKQLLILPLLCLAALVPDDMHKLEQQAKTLKRRTEPCIQAIFDRPDVRNAMQHAACCLSGQDFPKLEQTSSAVPVESEPSSMDRLDLLQNQPNSTSSSSRTSERLSVPPEITLTQSSQVSLSQSSALDVPAKPFRKSGARAAQRNRF